MNPLFKNGTRAIKAAMRAEFRSGALGRALKELERKTIRKGQAKRYLNEIAKKIHGQAPLPGWSERASSRVEKYAKQQSEEMVMNQIFTALGPLGDIVKSMLRPRGKRMASIDRELTAAQNLLESFGFEVIPPPPRRGGTGAKVRATRQYLEKLGFQVTPKPLPGWAAARTAMAPEAAVPAYRPTGSRRTVDLAIGGTGYTTRRIRADDPLLTGKMIPVVSTNVHSIGFIINPHNPATGTLKVRFLQSAGEGKVAGPIYEYYHVPTDIFQKFRKAASKGKFVWDKLRIRGTVSGHRFDYKLTGISRGYVPRKATYTPAGEYYTERTFLGENTRTGEKRLFKSKASALVRPSANRGTEPDRGTPNRGRR